MEYVTVEREAADEFIEKKSRFIGSCRPVQTEEEALDFIAKLKSQYWDASHNVYAYILREGNIARFSDDGEPQGTAGIPVIDTLKKAGVVDAVVVATACLPAPPAGNRSHPECSKESRPGPDRIR